MSRKPTMTITRLNFDKNEFLDFQYMRAYLGRVDSRLHDVRRGWPRIHDPDDYSASQALATELRGAKSLGIVYNSVRRGGGECIAAFTVQGSHFFYDWDGSSIRRYLVVGETRWRDVPR